MVYRKGSPLSWQVKDIEGNDIRFSPIATHQISNGDCFVLVRTVWNIGLVVSQMHVEAVKSELVRFAFVLALCLICGAFIFVFDQTKTIAELEINGG